MKRVLIITYYWPPSGGAGVQRWLKFSKYLPEFGWQPVIYTPENPFFNLKDESLLKDINPNTEILKQKIWEPYKYISFTKKNKNIGTNRNIKGEKGAFFSKIIKWVRGNMFIPDPRVYWVKPSVNYLKDYIQANPIDVIVSTGPPHSMHLIAQELKRQLGIKWIADFRDPFSKLDIYDDFYISKRSRKKYTNLEKNILEECDVLLATSYSLPEMLVDFDKKKMVTITNGFDRDDFKQQQNFDADNDKILLCHVGTINDFRNPTGLWKAIEELTKEKPAMAEKLKICLVGNISQKVKEEIASNDVLNKIVEQIGYLSHKDLAKFYQSTQILLLLMNQTESGRVCIPGKLFEYLAAHKRILALGNPESDTARILSETRSGVCFNYDDVKSIKNSLMIMIETDTFQGDKEKIQQFSRKVLSQKLATLLNQLTENINDNENNLLLAQ